MSRSPASLAGPRSQQVLFVLLSVCLLLPLSPGRNGFLPLAYTPVEDDEHPHLICLQLFRRKKRSTHHWIVVWLGLVKARLETICIVRVNFASVVVWLFCAQISWTCSYCLWRLEKEQVESGRRSSKGEERRQRFLVPVPLDSLETRPLHDYITCFTIVHITWKLQITPCSSFKLRSSAFESSSVP